MSEEINLHETMDAVVWTREFMRLRKEKGLEDEDTIRAWFANLIMTEYDHGRWKVEKESAKWKSLAGELADKTRELANIVGGMTVGVISKPAGNTVDKAYELLAKAKEMGL